MGGSTLSINAEQSEFIAEGNPVVQVVGPPNEQLCTYSNVSSHLGYINGTSNLSSLSSLIKLQVAQPPVATINEINDARSKLRESISLINSNVSSYAIMHNTIHIAS